MTSTDLQTIGRVVKLTIKDGAITNLPAKVDTGAYSSSIWATNIREEDGQLSFELLGPSSAQYSGVTITTKHYVKVTVENSFGHREKRYRVNLKVEVNGRVVNAKFTLANRELKSYPALIGRRLLNRRFIVNVAHGDGVQKSNWK